MKKLFLSLAIALLAPVFAFAANTTTVEGKISKIVANKKEIYVISNGKKHEFYFKENTELMHNGAPAAFTDLKVDQKVKVESKKVGQRTDPVKVEILD